MFLTQDFIHLLKGRWCNTVCLAADATGICEVDQDVSNISIKSVEINLEGNDGEVTIKFTCTPLGEGSETRS